MPPAWVSARTIGASSLGLNVLRPSVPAVVGSSLVLTLSYLEARKRVLGSEHLHVVQSMGHLSQTLRCLGDLEGARRLGQAGIEIAPPDSRHPAFIDSENVMQSGRNAKGGEQDCAGSRNLADDHGWGLQNRTVLSGWALRHLSRIRTKRPVFPIAANRWTGNGTNSAHPVR
jgi:hypothetical protein